MKGCEKMKKIYKNFDNFKNNILKSLAPLVKTLEIHFWGNFLSDFRLKIDFKDTNNTTENFEKISFRTIKDVLLRVGVFQEFEDLKISEIMIDYIDNTFIVVIENGNKIITEKKKFDESTDFFYEIKLIKNTILGK